MTILENNMLLAALLTVTFNHLTIEVSHYTISDDIIRSSGTSPVLGRGYSIGTDTFQSTCLTVNDVTSYVFDDMSKVTESEVSMEVSVNE